MAGLEQINEVFGNPDLDYIAAKHTSIGIPKKFPNGWSAASTLYCNKLDNQATSNKVDRYQSNGKASVIELMGVSG